MTDPTLPIDPTSLDDAPLKALSAALDSEQSRRDQLNNAAGQAASVCWQYKTAGGDPNDILAAVQAWITANS